MNYLRAVSAEQQQEPVLLEGAPVTIEMISQNGFMARVTGQGDGPRQEWVPLTRLQAMQGT